MKFTELLVTASRGDSRAQYQLGMSHLNGQGGDRKDPLVAAHWLGKAAAGGLADAQFVMGALYRKGQGVKQDSRWAVKWYQRAADQGHAAAQFNLGYCHESGEGVPINIELAKELYMKSSQQGDLDAQQALKDMGAWVPEFMPEADPLHKLRREAESGDAGAQFQLGVKLTKHDNPPN